VEREGGALQHRKSAAKVAGSQPNRSSRLPGRTTADVAGAPRQ
jgi:hypothetical protein